MPRDTRELIDILESKGQLKRVKAQVDPILEITEITDRVVRENGPALLFENVKGHEGIPLLINQYGTDERMQLILGNDPYRIGEKFANLAKPKFPKSVGDIGESFETLKDILSFPPRMVTNAPCQEIVWTGDDVDLLQFPILQCWPDDAGRFITLPQVFTKDPETGQRNLGMYRMQVYDRNTTGMHWQTHKTGHLHMVKAEQMGIDRLPVAVALGGDPVMTFCGAAPLPEGFDEVMFAGFIRRERVPMVKCKTVDLEVPADAEIVLEGYVDPKERRLEGPFGDHTGFYSIADQYPVFHVTAITHREKPIYPTTIVGRPPAEDGPLGKAIERMFLPLMKMMAHEIVDCNMPVEAQFHNLLIVSIKKRYPGHARKVALQLFGMGQMMLEKCIIVVDDWVNVQDLREVTWIVSANTDPARDITVIDKVPTDDLDHAAPYPHFGSKMIIDATKKIPGEGPQQPWPDHLVMPGDVKEKVTRRWKEYGL